MEKRQRSSFFQKDLVNFNKMLEEVRQSICFLEAKIITSFSWRSYQVFEENSMEENDDCCPSIVDINNDNDISFILEDLG